MDKINQQMNTINDDETAFNGNYGPVLLAISLITLMVLTAFVIVAFPLIGAALSYLFNGIVYMGSSLLAAFA